MMKTQIIFLTCILVMFVNATISLVGPFHTGPVGFGDSDCSRILTEVGMRVGSLTRALPLLLSGDLSFLRYNDLVS